MRSSRGKAPLRMTGVVSDEILTASKTKPQDDASGVRWYPHTHPQKVRAQDYLEK